MGPCLSLAFEVLEAALLPNPHPETRAARPAQGCLRRHLQSEHIRSLVPRPEEAACPCIGSSLCSPVMREGGAGVGNAKEALPSPEATRQLTKAARILFDVTWECLLT